MSVDNISSRKEQIEGRFSFRSIQLDLPRKAWPACIVPIMRGLRESPGQLEIIPVMFGMVPHWADQKLARQNCNSRTEMVAS
ncbi:SOS response-associated peptidase [Janthinobacterium sp. JC611]|uniref:SOS response-associated peptidase n=1 Tax=Janthinobacterium sp. JC611 TaxID=2816201 RepID=UPI001BFCE8F4|nr:SOS response-associated peptidase [Janthinobacterium sp. JC611]